MTNFHGQFCWHELMTDDLEAAKAFYGHVVGWDVQQAPVTGKPYFLFTTSAGPVGGVMDLPEECRQVGIPPRWNGYVAVEDVDSEKPSVPAYVSGTMMFCSARPA